MVQRDKIAAAIAVAALHALLACALLADGRYRLVQPDDGLKVFDVTLPTPPPPPLVAQPAPARAPNPEGAAAPPALKATASPVVAPKPVLSLPVPPPVTAAPKPNDGGATSSGASPRPGPGSGAGGIGDGTGSGRFGTGTGGGGGAVSARQIAGRIVDRDYPRAARRAKAIGNVLVHFTVATDGRVRACSVRRSSGNEELDGATCRLIRERFRFAPARDASGRAIPEEKAWLQRWWFERG